MRFLFRLADNRNPRSLAARMRRQRFHHLLALIDSLVPTGGCRILDLGGTIDYWRTIGLEQLRERGARAHIVNKADQKVDALESSMFTTEIADACDLSHWPDNSFDIVHSNSVIEHVGQWNRVMAFAAEARRLAPVYLVQTPNFWFPIEPHYLFLGFHWLPEPLQVALVRRFRLGWQEQASKLAEAIAAVQSVNLLDRVMMRYLFPDAVIYTERVLGLPKSLIAVRHLNREWKAAPRVPTNR